MITQRRKSQANYSFLLPLIIVTSALFFVVCFMVLVIFTDNDAQTSCEKHSSREECFYALNR
jgi:ABC-type sugar transport system permease subunit